MSLNKVDDERLNDFDNRELVELNVTITSTKPTYLQNMEDAKSIEARNENVDEPLWVPNGPDHPSGEGHYIHNQHDPLTGLALGTQIIDPATSMLLDSWKIRRTGFSGLSTKQTCRPYGYQLRRTARNSEASTPFEAHMTTQELLEEKCFHNKRAEQQVVESVAVGMHIEALQLRSQIHTARALEKENVETELVMKSGVPEPEPELDPESAPEWVAARGWGQQTAWNGESEPESESTHENQGVNNTTEIVTDWTAVAPWDLGNHGADFDDSTEDYYSDQEESWGHEDDSSDFYRYVDEGWGQSSTPSDLEGALPSTPDEDIQEHW